MTDIAWMSEARCMGLDSDRWFSEVERDVSYAKSVCSTCPSRLPCLSHALDTTERFGTWGGMAPRERRRVRRKRQKMGRTT